MHFLRRFSPESSHCTEQLAEAFLKRHGPNDAELEAFRKAVGWSDGAVGAAAKGNYHAQRMLWRQIKSKAETETQRQLAQTRLSEKLPVPPRFKHERQKAKEAARNEEALRARIGELEAQVVQMQQQCDTYVSRERTLSNALRPFMPPSQPGELTIGAGPTTSALPQPASPRAPSVRARPRSMHVPLRSEIFAPQFTPEVTQGQVEARSTLQTLHSRRNSSLMEP